MQVETRRNTAGVARWYKHGGGTTRASAGTDRKAAGYRGLDQRGKCERPWSLMVAWRLERVLA